MNHSAPLPPPDRDQPAVTTDRPLPSRIDNPAGLGKWNTAGFALLLAGLLLIAYWPAIRGGFIWDDDAYVTENQSLRSFSGLWAIWTAPRATPQYYPLVHTTLWLEYRLWGLNPLGYHLVNLLLHGAGSLLLWRVLVGLKLPGAWLAAALFAIHPVQVESVAWITERKNVLSGVFYFASALAYLGYCGLASIGRIRHRPLLYIASLVLFLAALLSKTVTCSLPAALLLILWWKRGRLERGDITALIPFFLSGLALGLGTVYLERYHVGAIGEEWSLTFLQRCLIAGRALWFYAWTLVCPIGLVFIYPRWDVDMGIWWQWIFPLAAVAMIATLWAMRQRLGRGPLVAVLFFAGTLFPALGFFDIYPMRYSFVADHFQYLACVGLFALFATLLHQLPKPLLAGLLLALAGLTWRAAFPYQNIESLWKHTLKRNPNCWMAHANLGVLYVKEDRTEEALTSFQETLKLYPTHGDSHYNLGIIYYQRGQLDPALAHSLVAVRYLPNDPEVRNNVGAMLRDKGRFDEAIVHFQEALRLKPDYALARANLADTIGLKRAAP